MKIAAIAAVATIAATSVSAAELGIMGLTAGGEAVAEYNTDAETMSVTLEPEIGYTIQPLEVALTASTVLDVYQDDFVFGDELPTVDFEARKGLLTGLEIYGGVGFDLEAEERTDIKVGVSFKF